MTAITPSQLHNNGENTLSGGGVAVGCLIDAVGGVRQVGFATAASASLASSVAAPAIIAIATAAGSLGLLASGALSMGFTATATIPDASTKVDEANLEFNKARLQARQDHPNYGKANDKIKPSEIQNHPRVKSAEQLVNIRKIGVVNQTTLFAMGLIQSACGVVYMLSSQAASVFHYSAILTGTTAVLASAVTNVALGAIYLFRGSMMIDRSRLALSLVGEFRKELQSKTSLEEKIKFLNTAESYGETYMDARVDASCLKTKNNGLPCIMTAHGFKFPDGKMLPYIGNEKNEYLARIEKGIFSEQLKHRLYATVGVTMIIGGILTLALTALTHGIAPIAISLGSAIFFMLAENIFFSFDTPQIFNWLRDRLNGPISVTRQTESPINHGDREGDWSDMRFLDQNSFWVAQGNQINPQPNRIVNTDTGPVASRAPSQASLLEDRTSLDLDGPEPTYGGFKANGIYKQSC